jgi:multidrug efflux pump subunit AcrA (membrane-fusion protein)
MTVKLQEELKSARNTLKVVQADLELEKERSLKREQEAFAARYQLVGVQEELSQMQEQVKLVEQERDALRTIAKNEEIARIAAEGRIPLPPSNENDEFASPKKTRMSLDLVTVISSAASEEELDNLRMMLEWEQQRANRAHDRVEFLEMECRLNCCASRAVRELASAVAEHKEVKPQSSTIFIPAEGVFRTVSPPPEESPWISPAKKSGSQPLPHLPPQQSEEVRFFARTPSCEPPTTAVFADANASLLSLLETPASPQIESRPQSRTESTSEGSEEGTVIVTRQEEEEEEEHNKVTVIEKFHTVSTTTRIPLAIPDLTPPTLLPAALDPALSPTMSREEALAMIRERRGRARSLAQGTMTPRKQMVEGAVNRRDISAPAIRSGNVRGKSQARVQV